MSLFSKLFSKTDPKDSLIPLYQQIVSHGRDPRWYIEGGVKDTQDGRFDMIVVILSIVLLKLEHDPDNAQNSAYLTEVFVDDMDGQMRELGMGDVVVGKHVGNMVGALGGRLSAYRDAFQKRDMDDALTMDDALIRNLYRDEVPHDDALTIVREGLLQIHNHLQNIDDKSLIEGHATW